MSNFPSRQSRASVSAWQGEALTRAEAPYHVESESGGFAIRDVLRLFRRNLWLMAITVTVTLGIATWLVTKEVQLYQSSATIRLIDRQTGLGGVSPDEIPVGKKVDPVQSELIVLTGRTVLGKAVDREGLRLFSAATGVPAGFVDDASVTLPPDSSAVVRLEFDERGVTYGPPDDSRTAAYGDLVHLDGASFVVPRRPQEDSATLRVVLRDQAVDHLQGNLSATTNEYTGGIQVTFTSTDRRIPPAIVNAIVETYKEVNTEMAREGVQRRREFLEEQLRTTDSLLIVAQTGLSTLRSSSQAYSAAGRFSVEEGNLISAEIQQAQLQADLRMHENILSQILQARSSGEAGNLNSLMSLPGIASDPVVSQLYAQLASHRVEREGMLAGSWARAPTHPDVQRLNTLIASTEENLVQAVRNHIGSLRAQIGALGAVRGRAAAKMSALPQTEVQEVYLTQNLSALQHMGDQLRDSYQAVRLEEAGEAGKVEIIQLATRSSPLASKAWVTLLLGVVVGLLLGGGAAVAREFLDNSINTPQEIEKSLLVPNLAVIPAASPLLLSATGSNGDRQLSAEDLQGTEAYRLLRTSILFSQEGLKTLVVTSATPGEGKTNTSANLATAYARQGLRVLLMECDLRRPALWRYFENAGGMDLGTILTEGRDWRQGVQKTGIPGLEVLLAGRAFPKAAEFFATSRMKALLDDMAREYDMVILDTSPLLVAADATVLGAIADGVLLVIRAAQTDRAAIQQAIQQLTLVGARVIGTVLNDPDGTVARYSHYYDYSAEYEVG